MHPAALELDALLAQCEVGRGRSGGPGGQNRNKVETLVIITHRPTGIKAHAGERRSQSQNKSVAVMRLRLALAVEVRHPVATPKGRAMLAALDQSEGSALWVSRIGGGRISCNPRHEDYPAMLAEAMDFVEASQHDLSKAARRLLVTPSQLLKLIKDHPPALVALNAQRQQRGEHPLK